MVNTFRLMNQIRLEEFKVKKLENLVYEYKSTNNQSIIAEIFCRNFKLLSAVVYEQRYKFIDKDDKVDAVMQAICCAVDRFDINKNVAFNTFLVKNLRCQLYNYVAILTQQRHKGIVYSLDAMRDNTDNEDYDVNILKTDYNDLDNVLLNVDLNTAGLSEREAIMCKAIMDNPNITNCELAELLKCHRHTIAKEKIILQQKLAFLI